MRICGSVMHGTKDRPVRRPSTSVEAAIADGFNMLSHMAIDSDIPDDITALLDRLEKADAKRK
jgi:hypothetical protein